MFFCFQCKQVAAHYQTELMKMIDSQLDPVMECSVMRLCGSKASDLKQAAAITPLKATVSYCLLFADSFFSPFTMLHICVPQVSRAMLLT